MGVVSSDNAELPGPTLVYAWIWKFNKTPFKYNLTRNACNVCNHAFDKISKKYWLSFWIKKIIEFGIVKEKAK